MIQDQVEKVLEASGISPGDDVLVTFEAWLGLSDVYEGLTVEDCAPLSSNTYESLTELFNFAWNPSEHVSMTMLLTENLFLESDLAQDVISLEAVLNGVKVTKWCRILLELSVDDDQSFLEMLLQHHPTKLLHAVYAHVQDLPRLQAQMHRYTQSLQQQAPRPNESSSQLLQGDPHFRLRQYADAQDVATRFQNEWNAHMERLEVIVGELYRVGTVSQRALQRKLLGQVWMKYRVEVGSAGLRQENTRAAGIGMTLHVLYRILLGVSDVLQESYKDLLFSHLIPLHKPDALVLWRDQTAVLELYHEALTKCIAVLLQKDLSLLPPTIQAMLQPEIFPSMGSTPKQVLLLHEIDIYLGLWNDGEGDSKTWFETLLVVYARCMSSEHSRVAERALEIFKNKAFRKLWQEHFELTLRLLLPALVRREPSWNPTVRKMTYHVLKEMKEFNEQVFDGFADRLLAAYTVDESALPAAAKVSSIAGAKPTESGVPKDLSLKAGMGSWRPPSTSTRRPPSSMPPPSNRSSNPPSTVTGVAPWAGAAPPLTVTGVAPWATKSAAPPSTVTGVAPWAVGTTSRVPYKRRALDVPLGGVGEGEDEEEAMNGQSQQKEDVVSSGSEYLSRYMDRLKPPEEEEGASSWSKAQMAESPTLLPDLKFHDLVFGQDLGTGAFGSVRYARLIDRNKTRSHWSEYAVKIISTEKIRELGYEASVQREIAVLRILSHPGIARLVSSFRFREGAYLVLEYASGGDLHSLLRKNGSLDHESTRFVIGEVVAALAYIHDVGLVYSDLKTENILITEPGHIKLTDFGGCRPIKQEAKESIKLIAKDVLKNLRDGDWKPKKDSDAEMDDSGTDMDIEEEDDSRIEGTTSYLPPEVVMGGIPSYASDSWALGCVTYQCLSGRPPFLEADDEATKHRIVSFDVGRQESKSQVDRLFEDKHSSDIKDSARDFIRSLLRRDPVQRADMQEVAQSTFFTEADMDVFTLHQKAAYPLDVGTVAPAPNAQWARRQYSSIWAPQPVAYDISMPDEDPSSDSTFDWQSKASPIPEGEEGSSFFAVSAGAMQTKLGKISERLPTRPGGK